MLGYILVSQSFIADDGIEGNFSYGTSLYFDFHRISSSSRSSGDGRSSWYTSTIFDRLISFECITDGTLPNIEPAVIVNDENCSSVAQPRVTQPQSQTDYKLDNSAEHPHAYNTHDYILFYLQPTIVH